MSMTAQTDREANERRYLDLRRQYGSRKLGRAWIPSTPLAVKIEIEQLLRTLNRSMAA